VVWSIAGVALLSIVFLALVALRKPILQKWAGRIDHEYMNRVNNSEAVGFPKPYEETAHNYINTPKPSRQPPAVPMPGGLPPSPPKMTSIAPGSSERIDDGAVYETLEPDPPKEIDDDGVYDTMERVSQEKIDDDGRSENLELPED
jgi:hypothetical protein